LVSGLDYKSLPWPEEPHLKHRATVAISCQIAQLALEGGGNPKQADNESLCAWALDALGISEDRQAEFLDGGMSAVSAAAQLQT
jgi:hypothetical protein